MRPRAKHPATALLALFVFAGASAAQTGTTPKDNSKTISNFPIPVGEKASGVRFPYYEAGKLKMFFNAEGMFRKDLGHLQMSSAKIVTYDDNEAVDLTLLLPVSLLDLSTRILTTDKPFVLKRTDFELMGDSLELDTLAHTAKVTGKVKMVIYNFNDIKTKDAAHE